MIRYSKRAKVVAVVALIAAALFDIGLIVPTIHNNLDDPNLIHYFNGDEGGQMDLIWSYYTGQRRDSFRWDFDHGLLMRYVADIARALSPAVTFRPTDFVLLLRWAYLLAWVGAIAMLWYLVGYHFGKGWPQALAALLLATRPALSYLAGNMKPEPVVLLCMIAGLHFALCLVEKPSYKMLLLAVAFASLAFIVKFAGLFLLPAIVAAVYLSELRDPDRRGSRPLFPVFRASWLLPAVVGTVFIAIEAIAIFFYVRKTTGSTWYMLSGYWGSILHHRLMLTVFLGSAAMIVSSLILGIVRHALTGKNAIIQIIDRVFSYALLVLGIFGSFVVIFGFRWLVSPEYFLLTYSETPIAATFQAADAIKSSGLLSSVLQNISSKCHAIGICMLLPFLGYLLLEARLFRRSMQEDRLRLYKRMTILACLSALLIFLVSMMRLESHHMLPFIAAFIILSIEGVWLAGICCPGDVRAERGISSVLAVLLVAGILVDGASLVRSRMYQWGQQNDAAFVVDRWWKGVIKPGDTVVADHYTVAYVPSGYPNVTVIDSFRNDRTELFRQALKRTGASYVYVNDAPSADYPAMSVPALDPDKRFVLLKTVDSAGRSFIRIPGDVFSIWKVSRKQ